MQPWKAPCLKKTGPPLVVKVGGSLIDRLPSIVPVLRASIRPLLIVPGGGPFADDVRRAGLDDDAAHWEAIRAMEKYGRHIASFGIPLTERLTAPRETAVLLPGHVMHESDPLPHSWDVTSDSIAAWVAASLHLDLVLVKSVDGIFREGRLEELVTAPVKTDVIDPFCLPWILKNGVETSIVNGSDPDLLAGFLRGERVRGTRISTTF